MPPNAFNNYTDYGIGLRAPHYDHKPEYLANTNPAYLRLRLQPYIRLLALHYPVDGLLIGVRKDARNLEAAISNHQTG